MMGGYSTFYGGSNYGLGKKYTDFGKYGNISPETPFSSFGQATDPRTANQLKMVSEKLNTGGKSVEVNLTLQQVADAIPMQHLEEINRLRKLTGVDLTLHGPLIDPTGISGEGRWDKTLRESAERQMWSTLQRGMKIQDTGNLVVTFHTNNGMMPPEVWTWNKSKNEAELNKMAVINERTGEIGQLPPSRPEHLIDKPQLAPGEKKKPDAYLELDKINKRLWLNPLAEITQELGRAKEHFEIAEGRRKAEDTENVEKELFNYFDKYKRSPEEMKKLISEVKTSEGEHAEKVIQRQMDFISRGDVLVRAAFNQFKEQYEQAYEAIERKMENPQVIDKEKEILKEDMNKLKEIKKDIKDHIDPKEEYIKDYKKLGEFADILTRGVEKLSSIQKGAPEMYRPLKDFAIEQASTTFGNLAYSAFKEVKGDINRAPIIAIENTPAQSGGMGISRAEEMVELIEESQKKFSQKLKEQGMSESQAKKTAEKMIGATWDVGHLNMLRKFGYEDKQLVEQTAKIAKHVKKLHLSDNFGFEHTELPMGMGNVPMTEHLAKLKEQYGEKMKEIKQVLETAQWHEHFKSPSALGEVASAYGSPMFAGNPGILWNQNYASQGGYFAGFGYNPDVHHSVYGAGFSGLPVELGGQMPGAKKSGFSGTPID